MVFGDPVDFRAGVSDPVSGSDGNDAGCDPYSLHGAAAAGAGSESLEDVRDGRGVHGFIVRDAARRMRSPLAGGVAEGVKLPGDGSCALARSCGRFTFTF